MVWRILWRTNALLLALMVGCSGPASVVRVESSARGDSTLYIPRTATVEPVEVTSEEATQAIRRLAREVTLSGSPRETVERLFQLDALSGDYLYLMRERQLVPLDSGTALEGTLTEADVRLASHYKRWCKSTHGFEGDCLGGALVAGKYLDLQGRYMWALAMSKSLVLEEFEKALGQMVSMQSVMQAALWTVGTLLFLLALPEPVTKVLAAWATVVLVAWIGARTLYSLIQGWFQLVEEVKGATTFEDLQESGERFGRLFERYHQIVFRALRDATATCRSMGECRQALTGALTKLGKLISTPGTELNQLVTQSRPR